MLDLLIRGGTVVDGTGRARRRIDVGVRDGRVVTDLDGQTARRTIDADGLVVAPGFVDLHTHYDAQLFWDPTASPSSLHGVTTVLGGNCGFSIAALGADDATYVKQMMAQVEGMSLSSLEGGGAWDWYGFGDYLERLEGNVAVNAGFLAGHSTLRRAVMGDAATRDEATPDQVDAMARLLHESLEA